MVLWWFWPQWSRQFLRQRAEKQPELERKQPQRSPAAAWETKLSPLKPTLSTPKPSHLITALSLPHLLLSFHSSVQFEGKKEFSNTSTFPQNTLCSSHTHTRALTHTHPGSGGCHPGGCTGGGGGSPRQGGCWRPARPVGGWWRRAQSGGWSLPDRLTGWPHQSCVPGACCLPSFEGFSPEDQTHTEQHDVKWGEARTVPSSSLSIFSSSSTCAPSPTVSLCSHASKRKKKKKPEPAPRSVSSSEMKVCEWWEEK